MKQSLNEVKRMQQLAGLILEAEENQPDPKEMVDAKKQAFQAANSSQFNAAMEKEWAKLSDEDKKRLAQSISSLNEAVVGNDFASFDKMVKKAEEEEGINEETSNIKAKVGNILAGIGMLNTSGFAGAPGAFLLGALGGISFAPAYLASFVAGGILWWIGKKLAAEKINPDLAEVQLQVRHLVREIITEIVDGRALATIINNAYKSGQEVAVDGEPINMWIASMGKLRTATGSYTLKDIASGNAELTIDGTPIELPAYIEPKPQSSSPGSGLPPDATSMGYGGTGYGAFGKFYAGD